MVENASPQKAAMLGRRSKVDPPKLSVEGPVHSRQPPRVSGHRSLLNLPTGGGVSQPAKTPRLRGLEPSANRVPSSRLRDLGGRTTVSTDTDKGHTTL